MKNITRFRSDAFSRYLGWSDEDREIFSSAIDEAHITDKALGQVLDQYKGQFDIVIGDFIYRYPSLHTSSIPFIQLFSLNPLLLYPNGPPAYSGYSVNVDRRASQKFRIIFNTAASRLRDKLYSWWSFHGLPASPQWFVNEPQYFGFYHYPEAMDYLECGPKFSDKWIRIDPCINVQPENCEAYRLPYHLSYQNNKLIFVSLGKLGSIDVDLFNTFLNILGETPYRYIVSKGPRSDEIHLKDNMCGDKYIDPKSVHSIVDLIITHGGNSSFAETVNAGKPLIMIPFFLDQFDNAQRVVDCGIGKRLDCWNFEPDIVMKVIDDALNDTKMRDKARQISQSMRKSTTRQEAKNLIEAFISTLKI